MLIRKLKEEYIIEGMKGNNFDVIYQFNKEANMYNEKSILIENKFIVYCNEDEKIYYIEIIEDILEDMEIKEIKTFKEVSKEEANNIKNEGNKYLLEQSHKYDKDIRYIVLDNYRMKNLSILKSGYELNCNTLFNIDVSVKVNFLI